jgi:hypothetical protein
LASSCFLQEFTATNPALWQVETQAGKLTRRDRTQNSKLPGSAQLDPGFLLPHTDAQQNLNM